MNFGKMPFLTQAISVSESTLRHRPHIHACMVRASEYIQDEFLRSEKTWLYSVRYRKRIRWDVSELHIE